MIESGQARYRCLVSRRRICCLANIPASKSRQGANFTSVGAGRSWVGEKVLQRSGSENGCRSRRLAADCRVVASEPRGVGISFAGEDGAQK